MLSLRSAIFGGLFAIALWGLFALLDNLREPGLLRTGKQLAVKGCDPIESDQAKKRCPQLFCEKFLLERQGLPPRSRLQFTVDMRRGVQHLLGGSAQVGNSVNEQHFACLLQSDRIAGGRMLEAAALEALAAQSSEWTLE